METTWLNDPEEQLTNEVAADVHITHGLLNLDHCPKTRTKRLYDAFVADRMQNVKFEFQNSTFTFAVDPEDPSPPTDEEKRLAAKSYSTVDALLKTGGSGLRSTNLKTAASHYGRLLEAARAGILDAVPSLSTIMRSQMGRPGVFERGLCIRIAQRYYTDNGECQQCIQQGCWNIGPTYCYRAMFRCEKYPPEVMKLIAELKVLGFLYNMNHLNSLTARSKANARAYQFLASLDRVLEGAYGSIYQGTRGCWYFLLTCFIIVIIILSVA